MNFGRALREDLRCCRASALFRLLKRFTAPNPAGGIYGLFGLFPKLRIKRYHSYLFQLSPVATCPLHGDPLVQSCPCCGRDTGDCAVTRELFLTPYRCPSCQRSLGLQVPTAATYYELKTQERLLLEAFTPYWTWAKRLLAKHRIVPHLFQMNFGRALRGNLRRWRASALCAMVPTPFIRAVPVMTVLAWRQNLAPSWRLTSTAERRVTGVYRATLRMLQHWILTRCPHSPKDAYVESRSTEPARLNYGNLDCRGLSREECAYILLRYAVERDYRDCSLHSDVSEAAPWAHFQVVEPSLEALPRLPLRAIFLAMYAESYLRLNGRDSFSPALEGVRSEAELMMCAGTGSDFRWGFVAFPPVPGMPVLPFHPQKTSIYEWSIFADDGAIDAQ